MTLPQSFAIQGHQRWIMLASPWIMGAISLLGAVLPFLQDERTRNEPFIWLLGITTTLGFGAFSWYAFGVVRTIHLTAVTADTEGIWRTALPRQSSLVHWSDVARLRERPRLQRLELLSTEGVALIKLEYQLSNFDSLRAIVLERVKVDPASTRPASGIYSASIWYHIFHVTGIFGFLALGLYVGSFLPLLGYVANTLMVALIAWDYATAPYRIRTQADAIDVMLPGRVRVIPREEIVSIALADEFANGMRHPYVAISVRGSAKPVLLKRIPTPAAELAQALQAWHRGDA